MITYKTLIEMVANREMGILGRYKTLEIFEEAGVPIDNKGILKGNEACLNDLDRVMSLLHEKYGPVAVMGCKIAVNRKAKEGNLRLPKLLG